MGIRLLEGRDFRETDDRSSRAPVAIVNQAFQRRFLDAAPVVGRRVRVGGEWFNVIGLVRDSKYRGLNEGPAPYVYFASRQTSGAEFWMAFFVRTNRPLAGMLPALGREAAAVNGATRGSAFIPYQEWIGQALYSERVAASMIGVVGAICLLLSAIGLYSVLTFTVKQRTHEIGIRLALGARSRQVLAAMLRQGMLLTLAGMAAGALAAIAMLKVSAAFLPKLRADDPAVFAAAALVLTVVALIASYVPSYRATKVDPADALRHE